MAESDHCTLDHIRNVHGAIERLMHYRSDDSIAASLMSTWSWGCLTDAAAMSGACLTALILLQV